MSNLVVRTARAVDSPAIVDIHVLARRGYYQGHLPEAELAEWERDTRATGYADRIERSGATWLCAELSGVLAGFALVAGLDVFEPNTRAHGFYVRQGWHEVDRGGEPPHVRMALDLQAHR